MGEREREREMEGEGGEMEGAMMMRWEDEIHGSPAHTMDTESFVDIY